MIKSFLNYPGGKYRLLNQLLPLFPQDYRNFVDLFSGSAVVSINQKESVPILAYDINNKLIELLRFVRSTEVENIISSMEYIIDFYNLSDTRKYGYEYYGVDSNIGMKNYNKAGYEAMRKDYNNQRLGNISEEIYLYALIVFGFNNQLRFNRCGLFNNPTGKRDFNNQMRVKLKKFSKRIKNIDIEFKTSDFRDVSEIINDAFYYVDPPYLVTTAVYNENGGWTEEHEISLLEKLDRIDRAGNKFALSNVLISKGKENKILSDWSTKYNVHHLKMNYGNSNYQTSNNGITDEVLITNYK